MKYASRVYPTCDDKPGHDVERMPTIAQIGQSRMDTKPYRVGRSHTGLGLFATIPIKKHAVIVEYSGPRIPPAEAHARERAGRSKYMFEISGRWTIDGAGRDNM